MKFETIPNCLVTTKLQYISEKWLLHHNDVTINNHVTYVLHYPSK